MGDGTVAHEALVLVELLGGAALIVGLFTRLLAFSMLMATVLVHLF